MSGRRPREIPCSAEKSTSFLCVITPRRDVTLHRDVSSTGSTVIRVTLGQHRRPRCEIIIPLSDRDAFRQGPQAEGGGGEGRPRDTRLLRQVRIVRPRTDPALSRLSRQWSHHDPRRPPADPPQTRSALGAPLLGRSHPGAQHPAGGPLQQGTDKQSSACCCRFGGGSASIERPGCGGRVRGCDAARLRAGNVRCDGTLAALFYRRPAQITRTHARTQNE